mmetsp:Transcript_37655/g.69473  ORF Transcript_37655/g.69473 Transcript_37655/m.69473 type:complete len:86 (+) Transcript_37655:556-813(+)
MHLYNDDSKTAVREELWKLDLPELDTDGTVPIRIRTGRRVITRRQSKGLFSSASARALLNRMKLACSVHSSCGLKKKKKKARRMC